MRVHFFSEQTLFTFFYASWFTNIIAASPIPLTINMDLVTVNLKFWLYVSFRYVAYCILYIICIGKVWAISYLQLNHTFARFDRLFHTCPRVKLKGGMDFQNCWGAPKFWVLLHFYVTISKFFPILTFLRGGRGWGLRGLRGGSYPPCPPPMDTYGLWRLNQRVRDNYWKS